MLYAATTPFPARLALRFAAFYFLLYNVAGFIGLVPPLYAAYEAVWHRLVPWVGAQVLHLATPITVFPGGSGDTTYNYVEVLCFLVMAGVVAPLWSWAARREGSDARLHDALRVLLRYVLAGTMVGYGFSKVFKLQFPAPSLDRLLQPYGESSPMGLLWTFMGASAPYTIFGGAMEVLGGLLLLFRRTTTLGALVLIGVMTNVVMLNFCYDVPVKLFSSHLLLMALFLLLPEARRLLDVLLFNRATEPVDQQAHLFRGWPRPARYGTYALKALVIAFMLGGSVFSSWTQFDQSGDFVAKPPLYGIYEVESFSRNGVERPPLLTDGQRWRYLTIGAHGYAGIHAMPGYLDRYLVQADAAANTLTFRQSKGGPQAAVLSFSTPEEKALHLTGSFWGEPLVVRLRRADKDRMLLVKRGFHWVNETPYNQ